MIFGKKVSLLVLFVLCCSWVGAQPKRFASLKNDTLYSKYMDFYIPRIKTRIKELKVDDEKKKNVLIKLDLIDASRHLINKDYHKALPLYLAILEDYSPMAPADSAVVLNGILRCYYDIKDLKHTLFYFSKLGKIKAKHHEITSQWFNIYLSNIYYNLGFYDEALLQQMNEKKHFVHTRLSLSSFYNNRGLYFTKAGLNDSAMVNFNLALDNAQQAVPRNEPFIALIKGNIGQLLMQEKKYSEAIPLLQEDIAFSKKDTNRLNVAINYIELSICFNALGKPRIALQYLDSFAAIKDQRIDESLQLRYLKATYEAHLRMGQQDSAIKYFQTYISRTQAYEKVRNDQLLYNLKVSQEVFELRSEVEDKRKELKEKKEKLTYEHNLQRSYIFTIVLLSGLAGVIFFLWLKLNRRRKLLEVKNQKITHQYQLLYKSLSDKEVLIKEIHHRVKNNLQLVSSLIRLQLNNQSSEQARAALAETNDRIISMSLLHQQLMIRNDESVIEISGYILNLVKHLQGTLLGKEKNIEIVYDIEKLYLPIDVASPICLIMNEVLVNSIKHAFDDYTNSKISIALHLVNNSLELVIKDNGKGFDFNAEKSKGPSLGLEIIETLSEQLSGKGGFSKEDGTVFRLTIPMNKQG